MTKAHLTRLWGWIALACFILLVASVITVQGGVDIFKAALPANRDKDGNAVVAYMAVAVGAPLLCLSLLIAILYARRHGSRWHERIPTLMLEGLDTASWEGRIFQGIVAVVLIVLPAYSIGHCLRVANTGFICEQVRDDEPPGTDARVYPGGQGIIFSLSLPAHKEQLRLVPDEATAKKCKSGYGLDWYTWFLIVAFPTASMILLIVWIYLLFAPRRVQSIAAERPFHTP